MVTLFTCLLFFFFFFSSRRRHTRCGRDWSSDVCSSDLDLRGEIANLPLPPSGARLRVVAACHVPPPRGAPTFRIHPSRPPAGVPPPAGDCGRVVTPTGAGCHVGGHPTVGPEVHRTGRPRRPRAAAGPPARPAATPAGGQGTAAGPHGRWPAAPVRAGPCRSSGRRGLPA